VRKQRAQLLACGCDVARWWR